MDLSQQATQEHIKHLGEAADVDREQLRAQAEAIATDYNLTIYGRDPFVYRALVDAILEGMLFIVHDYEQGRRVVQTGNVISDK